MNETLKFVVFMLYFLDESKKKDQKKTIDTQIQSIQIISNNLNEF